MQGSLEDRLDRLATALEALLARGEESRKDAARTIEGVFDLHEPVTGAEIPISSNPDPREAMRERLQKASADAKAHVERLRIESDAEGRAVREHRERVLAELAAQTALLREIAAKLDAPRQ